MQKQIAVVLVLPFLVACVHPPFFDRISYDNMAPRLEYQGFSFDRPPNRNWYFLQSEESYTRVILRRHLWTFSDMHSFYALVGIGEIEAQPNSHEEFAELARSEEQLAPYEIEAESYEQHLTTWQSQWCIRFESSYNVPNHPDVPDGELRMILRGYRCLHPAWPARTLESFYSERGLPDEIDPKLSAEGEVFLEGVRIDVGPGSPAT